jgi:hypothetical protein
MCDAAAMNFLNSALGRMLHERADVLAANLRQGQQTALFGNAITRSGVLPSAVYKRSQTERTSLSAHVLPALRLQGFGVDSLADLLSAACAHACHRQP